MKMSEVHKAMDKLPEGWTKCHIFVKNAQLHVRKDKDVLEYDPETQSWFIPNKALNPAKITSGTLRHHLDLREKIRTATGTAKAEPDFSPQELQEHCNSMVSFIWSAIGVTLGASLAIWFIMFHLHLKILGL